MFSDKLNEYIYTIGCTGKELSEYSEISESTISRYRTGERMPKAESDELARLCRGLCYAAAEKGENSSVSYSTVMHELSTLVACEKFNYKGFQTRLNMLFSIFSINASEISSALKYDSSYISRIRRGQRKPARPEQFAHETAEFVARRYSSENERKIAAELMGISTEEIALKRTYADALVKWLTDNTAENTDNPMTKFLEKLNDFEIGEYIKTVDFNGENAPSALFQLPVSKTYYGIEQMKCGELDFWEATLISDSDKNVFMCSDMKMDDMAKDMKFSRKYMYEIAAILKKGLHIDVIHNLNRPFNELMLGLECWIPLYMTGGISPYYLKNTADRVYGHFLNVSGAAALSGEGICGYHSKSKYYITQNQSELYYYRERADLILKKAQPLMEIYRDDTEKELKAFLLADTKKGGKRKNILSAPPLYTAPEPFLRNLLKKSSADEKTVQKLINYAASQCEIIEEMLEYGTVCDIVPSIERAEFDEHPITLPNLFGDKSIEYSFDDYSAHLKYTREFAQSHPDYSVQFLPRRTFANIQIVIHCGKWAMVSKTNSPRVHFIIKNPILRNAIENLELPF